MCETWVQGSMSMVVIVICVIIPRSRVFYILLSLHVLFNTNFFSAQDAAGGRAWKSLSREKSRGHLNRHKHTDERMRRVDDITYYVLYRCANKNRPSWQRLWDASPWNPRFVPQHAHSTWSIDSQDSLSKIGRCACDSLDPSSCPVGRRHVPTYACH